MENYKKVIGKTVVSSFDSKVTSDLFTKENYLTRLKTAAEVAEEMPFVTLPFREYGILGRNEGNARILHTFQPNLWAQDYAHAVGKLGKMTIHTAGERADAASSYVLNKSKNLVKLLREKGRTPYDFSDAYRLAAFIEAAYYTRLGGGEMSEDIRKKIDTALMRRVIRNESIFQTVLRHNGVDENDATALIQFSDEIDLTGILKDIVSLDPYYNRRSELIDTFTKINSEASVSLPQTRTSRFVEELLMRIGRKHPAMVQRVADAVSAQRTS